MLLCQASNLSSGWSLGSCAEHMKGKRAAGKVCCERVGGIKTCLPAFLRSAGEGGACARLYTRVRLSARLPARANTQGRFFCQTPHPAVTVFKRQRGVMLCFTTQTSGLRDGSRISPSLLSHCSVAREAAADHNFRAALPSQS